MKVFQDDEETNVISLPNDEPSTADFENAAHPVNDVDADPLSNDDSMSKADDESIPYTVSVDPSSNDDTASEVDDKSAIYTASQSETNDDDASAARTTDKASVEHNPKDQTEKARLMLIDIAEDEQIDDVDRDFAGRMAEIIEWWQYHAGEGNPTSLQIDFGVGSPVSLLMVLSLLPERFQAMIHIDDQHRSPSGDGDNLSWLHEQTTDTLVQLSTNPHPTSMCFGQGLASMVRDSVDAGWRSFTGRSWLEDQMHLWSNNELEPDLYRFPPGTEKIVFLFNPTETHWTVVEVALDDGGAWTYTLYNSLPHANRGPTWKACQKQIPLLEQLICNTSGLATPATRRIVTAKSARQQNTYDCGPIAVYNAIELLEGRRPRTEVDPEELRFRYLSLILDALYVLDQGLEVPAFKVYMRKVCLDYTN